MKIIRFVGFVVAFAIFALTLPLMFKPKSPRVAYDPNVCAGPPLKNIEARSEAMEKGYVINRKLNCIDKQSYDEVNAQIRAVEQQRAARLEAERGKLAQAGQSDFAQQRHGFKTAIALREEDALPLPNPPADLFVRSDYKNPQNYMLPGFVTPDPRDGQRHPAIIWLTGGDSNSLSDFWTPGPATNDQSASAFRKAGIVMAFPTLRGGNGHASAKELFLGEADDVLAAAAQLARLSYVDPEQIYLGGHSSGGTLALLTAALRTPFKAVFAFGPVTSVERYPASIVPIKFSNYDPMELKLRSPIHWLNGIAQPTYVIEGMARGNSDDLEAICAATRNPHLHCIRVRGADHFSVLQKATRVIAARLVQNSSTTFTLQEEDFAQ